MRKLFLAITAVLAMLASSLGALSPAGAQTPSDVYVLHGIPGVDVDIYVNGNLTLEGFATKDIAGPLSLPAGDYDIDIFVAKADPEATAGERTDVALIDVDGAVIPTKRTVSLVAHLGADGTPKVTPWVNNMATVPNGEGRVTVRHAAEAPKVDILANGEVVFDALGNGVGRNLTLPAGELTVTINVDSDDTQLLSTPLTVTAANNRAVYAIGTPGSTLDLMIHDIAVPEADPTGTIATAVTFEDLLSAIDYKPAEHGQILRMYQAFFNRQADVGGAQYWIAHYEAGLDFALIVSFFAHPDQPEFAQKYADIAADDHTGYVTRVYQHILDRDPEPAGLAYWVGLMDDGSLNRGSVVQYIALNQEFINLFPYPAG